MIGPSIFGLIDALRSVQGEMNVLRVAREQDVTSHSQDFIALSERIDRLTLVCRAMHEMLLKSGAYKDDEIRSKIIELDMLDGAKDGRSLPPPKKCPKCDAMICRKFNRCLFCGHEDREGSPFHNAE